MVYLPTGGSTRLDLADAKQTLAIRWFNPRTGGGVVTGSVQSVEGGQDVSIGEPPNDSDKDWLAIIR